MGRLPGVIGSYSNQTPCPQSRGNLAKSHQPVNTTTQQTVSPKETVGHALIWDLKGQSKTCSHTAHSETPVTQDGDLLPLLWPLDT